MKKSILLIAAVIMSAVFTVQGIASTPETETSPEYCGVETKEIPLQLLGEYDIHREPNKTTDEETDNVSKYEVKCPTWFVAEDGGDLYQINNALDINVEYECFQSKSLFISVGVKMEKLEYWSKPKNYLLRGFRGVYQPVLCPGKDFDPSKVYVYKMDKYNFYGDRERSAPAFLKLGYEEYDSYAVSAEDESKKYTEQEISLVKEGSLSKGYLWRYVFLKDKNNKLPQIGLYYVVSSQYDYDKYKKEFGLPELDMDKYKGRSLVVSLGVRLKGIKVLNDSVEPISAKEYVKDKYFIYETEPLNTEMYAELVYVDEKTEAICSENVIKWQN